MVVLSHLGSYWFVRSARHYQLTLGASDSLQQLLENSLQNLEIYAQATVLIRFRRKIALFETREKDFQVIYLIFSFFI